MPAAISNNSFSDKVTFLEEKSQSKHIKTSQNYFSTVTSILLLTVFLLVVVVYCNFVVLYVHRTLLKTSYI